MSNFRKISIISFAKQGQQTPEISPIVQACKSRQWDTQLIFVDPLDEQKSESETQNGPRHDSPRINNLSEAISASDHPVIAIEDGNFETSACLWDLVAERVEHTPIQTVFASRITSGRFLRLLIWLFAMMHRWIFGIKRNELQRGLTVINRSVLGRELPSPGDQGSRVPGSCQVTQMLALLDLQRIPIMETDINDPGAPSKAIAPKLRSLCQAFSRAIRFWWTGVMFPRAEHQLEHKTVQPIERIGWTIGLFLAAVFLLFRCLDYPLIEPDEPRNAQLALNLIESGQFMSLSLENKSYWDKPPLQIWAIAISYKIFGVSQFATRFPIALVTLLTVMSTLVLGKRLVGFRAAILGAALLLMTSGFVIAGRFVTMDASLTAMVTLFLLLGFIAVRDGFKKPLAIAAGTACGLGLLFKGPVILVLCVPPLLISDWLSKAHTEKPKRSKYRWMWFAIPALFIASPWFIATAIVHPDFISYFFWKHHVVRFSNAFNHRQPFWFYWIGIFLFMYPTSYLLPSAIKFMTSRRPENRLWRTREQGFLLLSALWTIVFFSLSQSKLPTYILPSFPPICLLMGVLLERKVLDRCWSAGWSAGQLNFAGTAGQLSVERKQKTSRTFLDRLPLRAPFELLIGIIAISIVVYYFDKSSFAALSRVGLLALLASLLAVGAMLLRSAHRLAWISFGLIALLIVSLGAHQLVPAISKTRSVHLATRNLGASAEFRDAPVVFFGRETYGAELILDLGRVTHFQPFQYYSMVRFLEQHPTAIIISSENPIKALREDLPWTIALEECEEGRRHLFISRPNVNAIAREQAKTPYR